MSNLQAQIDDINTRNKRVETDKAWETSWTRRISIAVITYFLAVIFMWSIDIPKPYLSALVPTGGFVLSSLSFGLLKKFWINKHNKTRIK